MSKKKNKKNKVLSLKQRSLITALRKIRVFVINVAVSLTTIILKEELQ
jgi:hypothetical protein